MSKPPAGSFIATSSCKRSPIGIKHLGHCFVRGCRRVPSPAANSSALTSFKIILLFLVNHVVNDRQQPDMMSHLNNVVGRAVNPKVYIAQSPEQIIGSEAWESYCSEIHLFSLFFCFNGRENYSINSGIQTKPYKCFRAKNISLLFLFAFLLFLVF